MTYYMLCMCKVDSEPKCVSGQWEQHLNACDREGGERASVTDCRVYFGLITTELRAVLLVCGLF